MAREPWTRERILEVIAKQGAFYTGPDWQDRQARRVTFRMVKAGILKSERLRFCTHRYTLAKENRDG